MLVWGTGAGVGPNVRTFSARKLGRSNGSIGLGVSRKGQPVPRGMGPMAGKPSDSSCSSTDAPGYATASRSTRMTGAARGREPLPL